MRVAGLYGYREIRTPSFEDFDLFARTAGDTSDVVTKQMYDFVDKGGRHQCLKAEGTAPAIRAVVEHSLCPPGSTLRLCYQTPVFRYERPQRGRLREHHQLGLELLGVASATGDAEVIEVGVRFLESQGLDDLVVRLNSLGREDCRNRYRAALLEFAEPLLEGKDAETVDKARANPLRLLDTKNPDLQAALEKAPSVLDFLEPESAARFDQLQALLAAANIPFEVAPGIVRGLDYYTETVFEVQSTLLGAQSAVMGGGRYDNLVKDLGGPPTPSVGFGMGLERLILVLEQSGRSVLARQPDVAVVVADAAQQPQALALARELRAAGLEVAMDLDGKSLRSQVRAADKSGAAYAAILGEDEVARGEVTLRRLLDGEQSSVSRAQIVATLCEALR